MMRVTTAVLAAFAVTSAQAGDFAPPAEAANASANILLVRHAEKACNGLDCDLSERGHAQAASLAKIVVGAKDSGLVLTSVHASSACRTVLTVTPAADALELPVDAYPAVEGVGLCAYPGDTDELQQPDESAKPVRGVNLGRAESVSRVNLIDAIDADAVSPKSMRRFVLAADHSNFVCDWFRRLDVPEDDFASECISDGGLDESDYADIYWLYDADNGTGTDWRLVVMEDAFDVDGDARDGDTMDGVFETDNH